MEAPSRAWQLDPEDPRAPSQQAWDAMSESEREHVVDTLPVDPLPLRALPEGDPHRDAVHSAGQALDQWFRRRGRGAYVGYGPAVYYPGERSCSPDIFVVLDVEPGERNSWVVSREGRGLDIAIEIHWLGHRKKDDQRNVEWFARLGIPEYFVLDLAALHLSGWRLPEPGATRYERLMPQRGQLVSSVLDLELGIEGRQLRFYSAGAVLPDQNDLIRRLRTAVDTVTTRADVAAQRAETEAQRAETEAQRAETEAQRADSLSARVAALEAELQRLRGDDPDKAV